MFERLAEGLVTRARAGIAEFNAELGGTGSTLHIEAGLRRKKYDGLEGANAHVQDDDIEVIEAMTGSRQIRAGFVLHVTGWDAGGRRDALRELKAAVINAFADDGVLYFRGVSDPEGNLRNKSGRLVLGQQRIEGGEDRDDIDRPTLMQDIDIICTVGALTSVTP